MESPIVSDLFLFVVMSHGCGDLVALIPLDFPSDLTRGSLTRKGGNMKFCQDGFDSDRRNKFKHTHTT